MLRDSHYDVFLSYNSVDRNDVRELADRLVENGVTPWFDEWDLQPGKPWQKQIEDVIEGIPAAAVFVGEDGVGPWQDVEIDVFLREFVTRSCPVIPVILPTCPPKHIFPSFLRSMKWVDFRCNTPEPFDQLLYGITGRKPGGRS